MLETSQGLMIGTASGWWVATGVPGASLSLRRINTTVASPAVDTSAGPLFVAYGSVYRLNGTQAVPVAALEGGNMIGGVVQMSTDHAGVAWSSGTVLRTFVWSEAQRAWSCITNVGPIQSFTSASVIYVGSGIKQLVYDPHATDPVADLAGFPKASVQLASYDHRDLFTVNELLVEVDVGFPTFANYRRSVGVRLVNPLRAIDYMGSLTGPELAGTVQTSVLPTATSAQGERFMVRFNPNDAGAILGGAPEITMEGVKVRRVIMRCEER
jgi:hypothetical protein